MKSELSIGDGGPLLGVGGRKRRAEGHGRASGVDWSSVDEDEEDSIAEAEDVCSEAAAFGRLAGGVAGV